MDVWSVSSFLWPLAEGCSSISLTDVEIKESGLAVATTGDESYSGLLLTDAA